MDVSFFLRTEIDDLKAKVITLRDIYAVSLVQSTELTALKSFNITDKFDLNRDDASYTLSISSDVPIDNILLQCGMPIDLLDEQKNTCVSSYSDCDEALSLIIFKICKKGDCLQVEESQHLPDE